MKKSIISFICFLLMFTSISFADNNQIKQTLKDMELVNNNMSIMIKQIVGDEPLNTDNLNKDIKFLESILGERSKNITSLYATESSIELKRTYSTLLNTISFYELSLNSMKVYINDNSKIDYFIETCTTFYSGNISLMILNNKNYN